MRNRYLTAGIIIIGFILLLMMISIIYTPYEPNKNSDDILQSPGIRHPLGTDKFGRDILSRIMVGTQRTIFISFGTVFIGVVFGMIIGSASGYFGGWIDGVLMRFNDVLLAFPGILIALLLISLIGKGTAVIIIALGLMFIPSYVRIIRGEYLRYTNLDFVNSARSMGASPGRIMYIHIFPNIVPQLIPAVAIGFSNSILAESSFSFLGLGVQAPDSSWGNIMYDSQGFFTAAPWITLSAGFMIIITILGFNFLAEGLSRYLTRKIQ